MSHRKRFTHHHGHHHPDSTGFLPNRYPVSYKHATYPEQADLDWGCPASSWFGSWLGYGAPRNGIHRHHRRHGSHGSSEEKCHNNDWLCHAAVAGALCGATSSLLLNVAGIGLRFGKTGGRGPRGFPGRHGQSIVGPTGATGAGMTGPTGPTGGTGTTTVILAGVVPNVVGMSAALAAVEIAAAGFVVSFVGSGTLVINQNPVGGTIAPIGSTVFLLL